MDSQLLIRIGSDPRWLFGGLNLPASSEHRPVTKARRRSGTLLATMLNEYLERDHARELCPTAARLSLTSQQVAIRQYIAHGVQSAFSPKKIDRSARPVIVKRIQRLLDVHEGHANRIINGLGILAEGPKTTELADHYWNPKGNFLRELDVGLVQLLACGSSEHLFALMLKPYQFIANTACAALRLRISGGNEQQRIDAKLCTKMQYPPFEHSSIQNDGSAIHSLTPIARMSLYGLALWQSSWACLESDQELQQPETSDTAIGREDTFHESNLSNVIRHAATEAPWVFPELFQIEVGAHAACRMPENDIVLLAQRRQQECLRSAQTDERYLTVVRSAISEVSLEVGKALCGVAPYDEPLGDFPDGAD